MVSNKNVTSAFLVTMIIEVFFCSSEISETLIPSPPILTLKLIPEELKCVHLDLDNTHPVIISSCLTPDQEAKLISVI